MDKKNLLETIKSMTNSLLKMAKESCWNEFSENFLYRLSEIKHQSTRYRLKETVAQKRINGSKKPQNLEEVICELEKIYDNLYDVNLYIHQATKNKTIIDIRYYPKSSLEPDYTALAAKNLPMLHCKIPIPTYALKSPTAQHTDEKFDINWHLGGCRHQWKMFWYKREARKMLKQRDKLLKKE